LLAINNLSIHPFGAGPPNSYSKSQFENLEIPKTLESSSSKQTLHKSEISKNSKKKIFSKTKILAYLALKFRFFPRGFVDKFYFSNIF